MNGSIASRILVTGGAGFIGSHLTEALLGQGTAVLVLDNFDPYYPRPLKEQNISLCRTTPGFALEEGDIRDRDLLDKLFADFKPEAVVHLAAKAGVRPSLENPALYADVNVRGTATLLEAARTAGVKNIVFASSSSVYGNQNVVPFVESANTDHPVSPYGATKKAGEALCYAFHQVYGLSISCLRFFTVYGPRQRPDLAIRKFVKLALKDEPIPVFGDGTSRRDYTHIRDILTGIQGAIHWGQSAEPRYGIFNLGSSHPIELRELISLIGDVLGRPVRTKTLPFQSGDVVQTFADTSLAESELGFKHNVIFKEGLSEFIEWMKAQRHAH
jgi:UDP-glucuronate 4-epimerase